MRLQCIALLLLASCHAPHGEDTKIYPPGTFGYDEAFLSDKDSNLVILQNGDAQVLISGRYQGKVFTSTAEGEDGRSLGWVHYKSFEGPEDPHMNAYGGENRLWLGPEGGRFSLFFHPGDSMTFEHWKTPPAFDTESWEVMDGTDLWVLLQKDMSLLNYAGTILKIRIQRRIDLLDAHQTDSVLGLQTDTALHSVGYRTQNTLTNTGPTAWAESTGMPCIWILDMFPPSPATTIVIPFKKPASGKPATTDYFGEIPSDRIKFESSVLYYHADGKSRGKLGIHPNCADGIAGSYDAENHILTIIKFDVNPTARYLNQEWNTIKPPFSGDAVNAYNDGPLTNGTQMGPFYELESVSPAAFLKAGSNMTHTQSVFHFIGPTASLDKVAKKVLGVSLDQIQAVFNH